LPFCSPAWLSYSQAQDALHGASASILRQSWSLVDVILLDSFKDLKYLLKLFYPMIAFLFTGLA
jgi:hypothetical protein